MKLNVNFDKITGKIKAMHAVGQPPRLGISHDHMHYLTEAHIPYSRLHDVGGFYGGFVNVDIPNVFRDFDADENDPASYDFAFTDILIKQLNDFKCEPIYRLGVTIENYHMVKSYRIDPPKDYEKWARICEHVIRHYTEGWAGGALYDIKYWEIWNEPENPPMWTGTKEQFYDLYEVAAKHLKKCFGDKIKVGGYGSCGFYTQFEEANDFNMSFVTFANEFLDCVVQRNIPLDFFSWHSYASVENTCRMADFVEELLAERGLTHVETHLNEWNNVTHVENRGTSCASAQAAAMMLTFQDKKTDILCYYDARIGPSVYGGMFNPITYKPFCTYYSFKAFGELYVLGKQAEVTGAAKDVCAVAATDGDKRAIMISNVGEDTVIETDIAHMKVKIVDETHHLVDTELDSTNFKLAKNQVALLTSY